MGQCHLRQNDSDVRDFAKYDGTMDGLRAVQSILPRGWSSSYTITEDGVTAFCVTRGLQQITMEKSLVTYMVVARDGGIELHDSSSFHFLFQEGSGQFENTAAEFFWGD